MVIYICTAILAIAINNKIINIQSQNCNKKIIKENTKESLTRFIEEYFTLYNRVCNNIAFKRADYDKIETFFENVLLMSDEEFDKFRQAGKLKDMIKIFYNGEKDPRYSESTWQDNLVAKDSNDQSMKR